MPVAQRAEERYNDSPFHAGDRIRKAREFAGYGTSRKTEFADLIHVNRGTLQRYEETGRIKHPVLVAISLATPVTLEWLLTGDGPVMKDGHTPNDEKAPTPKGEGLSLPELDSNQQPAG